MGLTFIGFAWLVPNHRMPWVSFWNEAVAFFGAAFLLLILLKNKKIISIPTEMVCSFFLICASLILQAILGNVIFASDLLVVFLYASAFLLVFVVFHVAEEGFFSEKAMQIFVLFAFFAVIVGLLQWLSIDALAPFVVDLPPGSSIISNVAQRNHFSTICFIGICLLLQNKKNIFFVLYWLVFMLLVWGVGMAQSRTALAQAILFVIFAIFLDKKRIKDCIFVLAGVALAFVLFEQVNQVLLLGGGREIAELSNTQGRMEIWRTMWVASLERPWIGHGWLQIASAHLSVAEKMPHGIDSNIIEYAHNLVLDFIVWLGFPLGCVLVGLLVMALYRVGMHARKTNNTPIFFAGIAVVVHGLVEYSHTYAYFLIPLAIFLGWSSRGIVYGRLNLKRKLMLPLIVVNIILGAAFFADYLKIEESFVDARFAQSEFGKHLPEVQTPKLLVLSQLQSYHRAIAFKEWDKITEDQLEIFNRVYEKFGYAPAIYSFALAKKIADPDVDEEKYLSQLCAIYSKNTCYIYKKKWMVDRARYFVKHQSGHN